MPPLWSAHDLVEATGGRMPLPFGATGVSIDTRSLSPGDLFVALVGENGDGHRFVADALARGAAGAMVHRDVPGAAPLLHVDDTLAALARLGGYARARFAGRVVAVTGSVGKTTTKEMLRCALSALGPTHAAVASYNNHWGVPLTLARLPADAAFCVVEIGMNHAGEIAPLARLARPHAVVITAVEKAHIGFLGSIEAIADEKASIMLGLEPDGVAVLPADTPLFPRLRATAEDLGVPVIGFGADAAANVRLVHIAMDAEGSDVTAQVDGVPVRFRLNAPGRHMAMNALAALGILAHEVGEDAERSDAGEGDRVGTLAGEGDRVGTLAGEGNRVGTLPEAAMPEAAPRRPDRPHPAHGADLSRAAGEVFARFSPISGRGARRRIPAGTGSALLLDESYNGNGASMRAALSVLALQPAQRRIAVLGDMLELGDAGPSEHAALASAAAEAADLVFTCGPLMRHLFDALPKQKRAAHAADAAALGPLVARAVAPGDAILVKGSLGSRMRTVVDALDDAAAHAASHRAGAAA
jgi:UDP-N-acetylmuramoyl-tripeptide--D-alanyl-D-alanine ligase